MSSRTVKRWVLKRETQARIEALQEAFNFITKSPETAFEKIAERLGELRSLLSGKAKSER